MPHARDTCWVCEEEFAFVPYGMCKECYEEDLNDMNDESPFHTSLLQEEPSTTPKPKQNLAEAANLSLQLSNPTEPTKEASNKNQTTIKIPEHIDPTDPNCYLYFGWDLAYATSNPSPTCIDAVITPEEGWPLDVAESSKGKLRRCERWYRGNYYRVDLNRLTQGLNCPRDRAVAGIREREKMKGSYAEDLESIVASEEEEYRARQRKRGEEGGEVGSDGKQKGRVVGET